MISRRIIRNKALHILYANIISSEKSINQSEKELFFSIKKSYDLYHLLLQLSIDVVNVAEEKISRRKRKQLPTHEDLHPNTRFIDNKVISQLKINNQLNKYIDDQNLTWINHEDLVNKLYIELESSDFYIEYMDKEQASYADDKTLLVNFYKNIVVSSDYLISELEDISIFWNDDLEFVVAMVIQSLGKFKLSSDEKRALYPMFKDYEDEKFAKDLIRKVLLNHGDNKKILEEYTSNWDLDRIAKIDLMIIEMAMTELECFPNIPVRVTLNEYIDIVRYYSTQQSNVFVNGILDRILQKMKAEGKVEKAGRGLE